MGSQVISFRFNDDEFEALEAQRINEESINQTASRILREALGLQIVDSGIQLDRRALDDRIEAVIAERTNYIVNSCEQLIKDRLEALEKRIAELEAPKKPATSKRSKTNTSTVKKPTNDDNEVIK